ncbi:MAG: MCE family protein [Bacteroidia bacterium]|jgi:phospholipid/cholesterol/gamma-HCH transport system substrate-binding protein|nr:MCE family protein [Bacteroidia bacterium]
MKRKFFTREVRVGIMAVVAIFVLYFGLNFLKGVDVFSPINYYYATYENVGGLVPSSPVYIKGFKVGQVEEVKYDFAKATSFVVKISVTNDIKVPHGAKIELFDDGLMGGKAIQLVFDPAMTAQKAHHSGDTIPSQLGDGLLAQLSADIMPKIESVSEQADSLLRAVRVVIEGQALQNSLSSIEKTTADLAVTSSQLKRMMNKDVPRIMSDVNVVTTDLKSVTGNLRKVDFAATFASIDHTIANLNLMTDKINNGEGSLGMLLNDKALYVNLNSTAASADKLLIDLKQSPKRYVHFSLFGSKN